MRVLPVIAASFLASALLAQFLVYPTRPAKAQETGIAKSILFTQAGSYQALAWLQGGERFPKGAELIIKDDTGSHPLVPSFYATADADVSFEGTSIVFSGRETTSDPWQIYELSLAERKPRRITSSTGDCIRPLYLPGGQIVYACKLNGQFRLETDSLGGGKSSPLSFAPGSFLPNDVLRDGRILFASGFPLGTDKLPELYSVYSDGSGVESYRCDHGRARFAGKQLRDGDILFVSTHGLARFTSPLAHETEVAAPAGDFAGGIAESQSGVALVSWRPGAAQPYALKRLVRGAAAMTTVAAQSGMSLVQPMIVRPRAVPNRHPSGLHEWTYSNLMALNASISRDQAIDIRSVAVVRVTTLDRDGKAKVLGNARVEKDGSFYVQVPGDQPLRFELLDAAGKVIRREQGWMWARSGEQRICVGCHAGPERAPDNAVPAVLLRSAEPTILAETLTDSADNGGR